MIDFVHLTQNFLAQSWRKYLLYILYIHCTNRLKVISCQEQIVRLLVVIHHENIHELTSLKFLKLNLEYQNIKMVRRTHEHNIFFFLSSDCVLNQYHAIGYHSCFLVVVFFLKKTAIVIAILGQKTLHWQLSKVIPSDMYNCNFEAIN